MKNDFTFRRWRICQKQQEESSSSRKVRREFRRKVFSFNNRKMQNFPSFRSSSSSSVDGEQQKSSFWKISLSMTLESFFRCDVFEFERVESKATFSRPYFLVFPVLHSMYHDVITGVDSLQKLCPNKIFPRLQQKLYAESKSKLKFFSVFQRYRQRPPVNLSKKGGTLVVMSSRWDEVVHIWWLLWYWCGNCT